MVFIADASLCRRVGERGDVAIGERSPGARLLSRFGGNSSHLRLFAKTGAAA